MSGRKPPRSRLKRAFRLESYMDSSDGGKHSQLGLGAQKTNHLVRANHFPKLLCERRASANNESRANHFGAPAPAPPLDSKQNFAKVKARMREFSR